MAKKGYSKVATPSVFNLFGQYCCREYMPIVLSVLIPI